LDETDIYRSFPPPAAWRAAIACFWVRRGDGTAVRVLPDTCVDVVWGSDQGAFVAGPDRVVQAAVVRLSNPGQRIDRLADELSFSERQLRRRFHVAVGYGPKTLQRVLRLRRFLARVTADDDDTRIARAACEAGYADQPHLGRECRALTGLSPGQLITGVVSFYAA
jgi:AraC-like DNA-binding protein